MRKFYEISIDDDQNGTFLVKRDESGSFDIRELWRGVPFQGQIPEALKFYVNEGNRPDYLANLIAPICNEKLTHVIQKRAGKNAQFFPASIFKQKTSEPVPGYYLLNVAKKVECLDWGRSGVEPDKGLDSVPSVENTVIREEKVPENVHLFRVAECLSIILVSEELYEDLLPIEQWSGLTVRPCETSWSE